MAEVKLIITCEAHELADELAKALGSIHRIAGSVNEGVEDTAPPETANGPEIDERNGIKAELDRLGIEYNTRLATKNLKALLEEEQGKAPLSGGGSEEVEEADVPQPPDDVFGDDEPAITKEDVRAALVGYVEANPVDGQSKARELLKEAGGVDRLAKLEADKFHEVMKAIEKASK